MLPKYFVTYFVDVSCDLDLLNNKNKNNARLNLEGNTMGTCNVHEHKIKNFWCDTLSSFCKNILRFKEECCMQGNLCLTLDKTTSVTLNVDTTIDGPGRTEQGTAVHSSSNSFQATDTSTLDEGNVECQTQNTGIISDPGDGIHNFLKDSLSSFCKNMIEFKKECTVVGKLCITIDKEKSMLVEIKETVHGEDWALLTELLTQNSKTEHRQTLTETSKCATFTGCRNATDDTTASPILIVPCDSDDRLDDLITGPSTNTTYDCPEMNTQNQSTNIYKCCKPPQMTGSAKRKRKQANPVSLSSLELSPKVIVIEPDESCSKIGQCATGIHPLKDKLRNICQTRKASQQSPEMAEDLRVYQRTPQSDSNNLLESQLRSKNDMSNRMPLMVHLLQQQAIAHLNTVTQVADGGDTDLSNIPELVSVSNTSAMGNLDVLAERVLAISNGMTSTVHTPFTGLVCDTQALQSVPYDPMCCINTVGSDSEATPSKSRSRTRYVNSLSEVPDDEVHHMLTALIASGQTKESCDAKQCSICCPTLAYIRFRDRNRKNKSRFSMEKIEQVVNVKQYGGGTKYRDVQRMFTTHLRKLRAKHMCDKKCLCCEKLLLRESKKPNSNYLPHNVVPYKNLQQKCKVELQHQEGASSPVCT